MKCLSEEKLQNVQTSAWNAIVEGSNKTLVCQIYWINCRDGLIFLHFKTTLAGLYQHCLHTKGLWESSLCCHNLSASEQQTRIDNNFKANIRIGNFSKTWPSHTKYSLHRVYDTRHIFKKTKVGQMDYIISFFIPRQCSLSALKQHY